MMNKLTSFQKEAAAVKQGEFLNILVLLVWFCDKYILIDIEEQDLVTMKFGKWLFSKSSSPLMDFHIGTSKSMLNVQSIIILVTELAHC